MVSAHVIMLRDTGLIDDDALAGLLQAIESTSLGAPSAERAQIGAIRDFDERLDGLLPAGLAGTGRVGRGTIDISAAVARKILRDELIRFSEQLDELRSQLIELAGAHITSLVPVYVDGQVMQPTTIGHVIAGLVSQLARAAEFAELAFTAVNVSPLGSGAMATTGMPIDRERLTDFLGFDGLLENTLDAVSATDHFSAIAGAVEGVIPPIRRLCDELLAWNRAEPGSVRFGPEWTSLIADVPQANPAAGVKSLIAELEAAFDSCSSLRTAAARVPFGPITGELDALLELALHAFEIGIPAIERATAMFTDGFEINRALLANRAGKGFSTSSDLADFLMIEEQIEPGPAQNIAALTISRAREMGLEASGITPELIDGAALLVIGREIKVEFEGISRYLAPRRFIERRTVSGGPNPEVVRAHLDTERARLTQDIQRRASVKERLRRAESGLSELEAESLVSARG
jgi:argininosuccinate lyase